MISGTLLSGGEKDRKIAAWDSLQNYKHIADTKLPESAGGIRTIFPQRPGRDDGNIYVGTTKNNIVEGSLQRRFNEVIFGHGRQLFGLAVHPEDELFATAGMDKTIVLWRKHKLIWTVGVDFECISLAFHPFGNALAVGTTAGHLLVLNVESGEITATVRVCAAPLNCIAFNQGNVQRLAVIIIKFNNISNKFHGIFNILLGVSWGCHCNGFRKWLHLLIPCYKRWFQLQKTKQNSWNTTTTTFGLECRWILFTNCYG